MKNRAVIVIQSSGKYVYGFVNKGKNKQIPLFAVLASCVVQN